MLKKVRIWIALLLLPSLIAGVLIYNIVQYHAQLPMLEDENIVTFSDTCVSVDEWRKHAPTSTGHSVHWFNYTTYYRISLARGAVYDSKGERFAVSRIEELEKCEGRTITVQTFRGELVGMYDAENVYMSLAERRANTVEQLRSYAIGLGITVLLSGALCTGFFFWLRHTPKALKSFSRATKDKNRALREQGQSGPPVKPSRKKIRNRRKDSHGFKQSSPSKTDKNQSSE